VTQADAELLLAPPSLDMTGRSVWITGASRGLGRTMAYAFAGAGADLVLTARSAEALDAVAADLRSRGRTVRVAAGSVSDPALLARVVELATDAWGALDALVNNAGISPVFKRAELVLDDEWREVMETNLYAPFACAKAVLPLLEAARSASIVNVSSLHGTRAHERLIAYAASKGGLEMVTRTLAVEWAPRGVRVNSLASGYLETDMTTGLREHPKWRAELLRRVPLARFGSTSEIVSCAMFLASPLSSYVTGATLFADGGWSAA
jgi:NAD(P)-dependent dehydrogenase (short-subunit alcohol dehydrogenase family)